MERGGISARQVQGADAFRDPLSRADQAGGGAQRGGEFQRRGAGMERTDHFSAQDHPRRRGQELRHSGGAAGRSAEGDFGSRQRHPCAFGKPEWRGSSRQSKAKKIAEQSAIAKAATRFVLYLHARTRAFVVTVSDAEIIVTANAIMPIKTEKNLSEDATQPLAESGRGDRAAELRLRHFPFAGNPETRARISDRPATFAPNRGDPIESGEEEVFQRLDRIDGVMKAQREMKKDAKRAVELIEKILEDEPYNRQANLALKGGSGGGGLARDCSLRAANFARRKRARHQIAARSGATLSRAGRERARGRDLQSDQRNDPADAAAMRLGKDASARDSMKSGGWAAAESYRDLIKDKEAAVSLEQQSRMQLTGESLGQQIAETYARHQAEPQGVDVARRLGALSEQKDDLDAAIAWYRYASDLTHGSDPGSDSKSFRPRCEADRARDREHGRICSRVMPAKPWRSRKRTPHWPQRKSDGRRS